MLGGIPDGQGSSPRMRGAHPHDANHGDHFRIIPADAGSTRRFEMSFGGFWDHPRGCGEHGMIVLNRCDMAGSSPRMRGARPDTISTASHCRIIPADAGSTSP